MRRKYKSTLYQIETWNQCAVYNKLLIEARKDYYSDKVEAAGSDSKGLFKIVNDLLKGENCGPVLPSGTSPKDTAKNLSKFFSSKIEKIRNNIMMDQVDTHIEYVTEEYQGTKVKNLSDASQEEVKKIIEKLQHGF
ncbi:hypothetical protein ACF0H5_015820 [Mactra antiquata]